MAKPYNAVVKQYGKTVEEKINYRNINISFKIIIKIIVIIN